MLLIRKIYYFFLVIVLLGTSNSFAQTPLKTDVLIIGGGASGTAAAIQAARMGVNVILVEETTWLGGMITAAGVSAFDGNHNMPSGIWGEFREHIYKRYGGPNKVATGWVSNTLFEPHVGDSIFKLLVSLEKNIKVLYNHSFIDVLVKNNTVVGAKILHRRSRRKNHVIYIQAKQTIDATELGDVMHKAKVPYHIGLEASKEIDEDAKVPTTTPIIQDLTWVAILKDYGTEDKTIDKPLNYDPMEFDGCCNEFCSQPEKLTSNVTAKKMLEYGKLPNNKYMINWPGKGNDIYLNIINLNPQQRQAELQKAKAKTLRFLYFLQTQFGFKNLGLANDEFPTHDKLALIPYHRESRRLDGLTRFKVQYISKPFTQPLALYKTGIAVGDYPIDHHHRENLDVPKDLGFYPVPSYNLPFGSLVPKQMKGLIVAEKSISVSNIVNGTTRLQPVVLLIGHAAGTLAALCVQQQKPAQQISVRKVQEALLQSKAYIMPYYDVKPNHPHFIAIQKIGATGILKGKGEPHAWANRTWFYPDSTVNAAYFFKEIQTHYPTFSIPTKEENAVLTIQRSIQTIQSINSKFSILNNTWWQKNGLQNFDFSRPITRAELAVLLNNTINPFNKEIDFNGHFKQ